MTNAEIDQLIYNTAIDQGFNPYSAKLIVAQARFESANYTSNVFLKNNNTSGIKYIGQPNATQGTLSPEGNYYAKFNSIEDAINDKIIRLYNITMSGVTPQQLKDSTDADDFARLLKKRRYYGDGVYGTPEAEKEISNYASGLKARLIRVNVLEFYNKNKGVINYGTIGIILIGLTIYGYYLKKKKVI
jgi:hypothetical protein